MKNDELLAKLQAAYIWLFEVAVVIISIGLGLLWVLFGLLGKKSKNRD